MIGSIAAATRRLDLRQLAIAAAIAVTVTYSLAYTSLQYVDSENHGSNTDILPYMALARGEEIDSEVLREARILTIWLVRALPDPPGYIFAAGREVDEEWLLKVKFAAVNSAFLIGTALLLWFYSTQIGFSVMESYLAMLLFLTSLTVVYQGAIPLVDPSAFFFIAFGVVAIAAGNLWLFAIVMTVGLFAKESVGFILPLALVTVPRRRLWWLAAALPGIAIYMTWRWLAVPQGSGDAGHLDPDMVRKAIDVIPSYLRINRVAELVSSFGLLWVPAVYALVTGRLSGEMRRQYLWVVALLAVAVFLATGLGRTLFLAFPVIIPSAVIGIRHILRRPEPTPTC
jgi:hypothetical protein